MKKFIRTLFSILFVFQFTNAQADTKDINIRANNQATKYVAFIVGNNSYKTYTSLHGPDQDVKAIKNIFNDMGFKIINTKIQNLTKAEMEQATQSFIREIDKNTVAIFYYSGHGTSYENTNYLVPVNADFISEAVDADLNLYSADKLLNLIEQKGARTSIAIFDSCRNNLNISKDKSVSPNGFTIMASSGTQVVYATAPGIVARSATSPNAMSPFTQALIESINDSNNMTFYDVIRQASRETKKATNNAQQPYVGGTGDFEFVLRSNQIAPKVQTTTSDTKVEDINKLTSDFKTKVQKETNLNQDSIKQNELITQYNLGLKYYEGKSVAQDYKKAIDLFLKSADQNLPHAQYMAGQMLRIGQGVAQDYKKAMELLMRAAEQNLPHAQHTIGEMYSRGEGVPEDHKKAMEWYMKAAEQNYPEAQLSVGWMYIGRQDKWPKDYSKAMDWFIKAANQNYPNAKVTIGDMYHSGEAVPRSYEKAMEWYLKAAEQNLPRAQHLIGEMYSKGEGVAQDYKKAMEWYMKAAEQGRSDDKIKIGEMYYKGEGVPQDYNKAFDWYMKAAVQGDVETHYLIGTMYYDGNGVMQDYKKAMEWYLKAAEDNSYYQYKDLAKFLIGDMYMKGNGVPKDINKARSWFQKSSHPNAIRTLAILDTYGS